jgi:hypothetical protein
MIFRASFPAENDAAGQSGVGQYCANVRQRFRDFGNVASSSILVAPVWLACRVAKGLFSIIDYRQNMKRHGPLAISNLIFKLSKRLLEQWHQFSKTCFNLHIHMSCVF